MVETQEYPQQHQPNYFLNPMQQYGSTVLLLTSPDDDLRLTELWLRSMREDSNGNTIQIPDGKGSFVRPLMSEHGIVQVLGLIQTTLSRVAFLSNITDKEILSIQDYFADTLARDLMLNRFEYGIYDMSARDRIYTRLLTQNFLCLKRAQDEGERRFMKGSQQEITTRVHNEGQSGGGIVSRMLGWGRGK